MAKQLGGILMYNIFLSVLVSPLLIIASAAWGNEAPKNKEIQVFIEQQILVALEDGEEVYNFDIVTGRDGKETTAGRYQIFRKHEKYNGCWW